MSICCEIVRLKDYGYLAKLIITKRIKRNKMLIDSEYDLGYYKKMLDEGTWEKMTLDDLVSINLFAGYDENEIPVLINDKWSKMPYQEWYRKSTEEFSSYIKKYVENERIVELGCGYGRNLFLLRHAGLPNELIGYDVSKNGIQLAKVLNQKHNLGISFDTLDLTKPIPKDIVENSTVITYAALEQLKSYVPRIINELRFAKQIIHFENVEKPTSLQGLANVIYKKTQDYQNNLLESLKEQKPTIKKLNYVIKPFNQFSCIYWKPNLNN